MRHKKPDREVKRVVERVLPLIPRGREIGKGDFEVVLGEIFTCVDEKTGAGFEQIDQVKDKVLADLPNEYGRLHSSERSWPALITYLYTKTLRELSVS